MTDTLMAVGTIIVIAGAWCYAQPLGVVALGVALIGTGVVVELGRRKR